MNNLLRVRLNVLVRLSTFVKKQLLCVLSCIVLCFSISITLRFSLSFGNQMELELWHMVTLGPGLHILLWTELAGELFGTFKRDNGDIIENTIVCLADQVSFMWNTDWFSGSPS